MSTYKILIRSDYLHDGLGAILGVGHGLFGNRENEFFVTDAALSVLDERGIPYSVRNSAGQLSFRNRNASRRLSL